MATVTKPIALDESLNTTELSSRNVADVLAQELSAVATAIGGIAVPSADHVSYDNSVSGLSATDVQNALDEIVSDIPTVNNGTLTIQQNGTSIGSFSANTASNVTANIKTPTADKKTATSEFSTADGGLLSKCMIDLVPVQSGSGDPYPAGGGKNKLPLTVDNIKSANTSGSWSGNTYSINGAEYKINTDNAGNVASISARNLSSAPNGDLRLVFTLSSGSYILSSGFTETNGTNDSYLQKNGVTIARGNNSSPGSNFSLDASSEVVYHLRLSKSGDSSYIAYPMIRLSTVTDATFAPYSNVRPISGHTEVDLYNVGKNRLPKGESSTWNGVVFTIDADGVITANNTATSTAFGKGGMFTLPAGTYILNGCPTNSSGIYMDIRNNYGGAGIVSGSDSGSGLTFTLTETTTGYVNIRIPSGVTCNNLAFKPMIRLATESDSTFEPYLGHLYTVQIGSTVYGGYVDLVSGEMTADKAYIIFDGSVDENWSITPSVNVAYIELSPPAKYTQTPISNLFKGVVNTPYQDLNFGEFAFATNTNYKDYINIKSSIITSESDLASWRTWLSNNNLQVCYELATPQTIQLTPQQIEALVGENNLSTPLSGQSIETNGVEYKELFTWDDVQSLINNDYASSNTTYSSSFIETKFALKYDLPLISSKVVKASGSTSVTFSHERIFSADQTYCELLQYGSGDRVVVSDVSVTTGSVTFTFASATTQSITFRCRISNVLIG